MKKPHYLCTTLLVSSLCFLPRVSMASELISQSTLVTIALPVVAFAYTATISDYEGMKELAYSCAFTAQLTTLLKNTVQRTRPNGENDLSFPSGHASAAFTGASYMHHRYGLAWGVPMYGIAAVISVQRMNVGEHYWTDIIAGGLLGCLSGYLFTVKYPNVWVAPSFDSKNKNYGVQFNMNLG